MPAKPQNVTALNLPDCDSELAKVLIDIRERLASCEKNVLDLFIDLEAIRAEVNRMSSMSVKVAKK